MHAFVRQLGLALILFAVWLTAAGSAQLWLRAETHRVEAAVIAAKKHQFSEMTRLIPRSPEAWTDEDRHLVGRLLSADVAISAETGEAGHLERGVLRALVPLEDEAPGLHAVLTFRAAGAESLALLHQRVLLAIALLALLLLVVIFVLAVVARSSERREDRRLVDARAEMEAVRQLARISAERTEALASETGARRRAEETLEVSRVLLDHSVEDRVRLGRDLHDNLCQTLYAVTLNLESVRKRLRQQPAEAEQNLTVCMEELRAANREVRAHIAGLSSSAVRRQTFVEALEGMLASLSTLAGIRFDRRIDPEAAGRLTPPQVTEALSIVREAISNAVRHGGARTVTVHVQRDQQEVLLAVHDDGSGFDPGAAGQGGHGLDNMQARARSAGGKLRVVSHPGEGARVSLVLPVLAT